MVHTEEEVKEFVGNLVSDFKEHKQTIIRAYGKEKVEKILKERIVGFGGILKETKRDIPDAKIEDIILHFNDEVDRRCFAEGGHILDNLYNKQLNIIAGMVIRGHEV